MLLVWNMQGNAVREVELTAELVFGGKEIIYDQSDPGLLKFIKKNHLFPPSTEPYNLNKPLDDPSIDNGKEWRTAQHYLGNITGGFFIECGANDGEFFSNTLVIERDYGWNGLLIESDPSAQELLFKKNRKAWVANVCVSTKPYPQMITMKKIKYGAVGGGVLEEGWKGLDSSGFKNPNAAEFDVKCVPFFSIMSALGVFTVDFFALDVEWAEYPILQTIPFDKILIKVLVIEVHPPRHKKVVPFMMSKGYKCMGVLVHYYDHVFVHEKVLAANPELKPFGKCAH
jgi:hypothetical protein